MPIQARDFLTPSWLLIAVGLVLGGGVGLYEMFVGHLFATNNGLVWTLPLITYVFLALTSTGVSLLLAFGLITRNPVIVTETRTLLIIAIGLLFGAFTALATELGSLLNMIWILLSPNPSSPIWWMGTLYSIELALLLGKLVIDLKGWHGSYDRPLAWGTLVIAAAAAVTFGTVFGTVSGRADYHGALLSLITLTSAVVGGTAVIVLLRPAPALATVAGKALRAAALLFAALLLARVTYEARGTSADMLGWAKLWMVLPFFAIMVALDRGPRLLAGLGFLGTLAVHYSFIITGQLRSLGPKVSWYGEVQSYQPNLAELMIFMLGIAVAAALIKLGRQLLMHDRANIQLS